MPIHKETVEFFGKMKSAIGTAKKRKAAVKAAKTPKAKGKALRAKY